MMIHPVPVIARGTWPPINTVYLSDESVWANRVNELDPEKWGGGVGTFFLHISSRLLRQTPGGDATHATQASLSQFLPLTIQVLGKLRPGGHLVKHLASVCKIRIAQSPLRLSPYLHYSLVLFHCRGLNHSLGLLEDTLQTRFSAKTQKNKINRKQWTSSLLFARNHNHPWHRHCTVRPLSIFIPFGQDNTEIRYFRVCCRFELKGRLLTISVEPVLE